MGYGDCVYILNGHRAISLPGFYNGPVQSRVEIDMRSSCSLDSHT